MTRRMGPIQSATIVCNNLELVSGAYLKSFDLEKKSSGKIDRAWAKDWDLPKLEGLNFFILGHVDDIDGWLRLIEDPKCAHPEPLATYGWMSLEVNVADVDLLVEKIDHNYFTVIGEPADLEMSENIRAMQICGLAGEVIYLTTIKAPCPPFELPMTEREVDKIFIPVLSTKDRASSLEYYQELSNEKGLAFDTKITVLNRQFNKPIASQYPIATLQLNGDSLIEIDQVEEQNNRLISPCGLPVGIAVLSFYAAEDLVGPIIQGPSGEMIEFVLFS